MFKRNSVKFAIVFLSVILSSYLLYSVAKAESFPNNISWTNYNPVVVSSEPSGISEDPWCSTMNYQTLFVSGELNSIKMCMMSNENVRFGLYFGFSSFQAVFGIGNDSTMYKLPDICGQYDQCLYLPGTDTLVKKEFLNNDNVRSLVIYKNFSTRLTKYIDPITMSEKYSFDNSGQVYTFQNSSGYQWLVGGRGASKNGKWLAVEIYSRSIGLLNIETLQMRRISGKHFTYDVGLNQMTEFSVSNDGKHVALMGINADIQIYDVDDTCGDIASDYNMNNYISVSNPCKKAYVDYGQIVPNFRNALLPKFNDDGGQLSFYATSDSHGIRRVLMKTFGYTGRQMDYIAFGDSYSSGEGEFDDIYYINGTNSEFEKCHTSARSYPFLISEMSGIIASDMRSVACSGATTYDVIGKDDLYMGQGSRLSIGNLDLSYDQRKSYQVQALSDFIPGRIHQESFAKLYKPSVITIGIGGNDAGLMNKLTACLAPYTCKWAGTDKGREQSAVEIKNLYPKLVETFTKIYEDSPNSKLYVIGYPLIIDANGTCSAFVNFLFDKTERQYIVDSISYLNQIVESAAVSVGAEFVDISEGFGGYKICGSEGVSAANTVQYGDDMGIVDFPKWYRFIGQESFHPNPLGHYLSAQTIMSQIGSLLINEPLRAVESFAKNESTVPEPPISLLPDGYHDYPLISSIDFMFDDTSRSGILTPKQLKKQIVLPEKSLKPNSTVKIEIDYIPELTWSFQSFGNGSLSAEINIPAELPNGIYTFHLIALSNSGEPIDYYQTVKYWDETLPIEEDEGLLELIAVIYAPPPVVPVIPSTTKLPDKKVDVTPEPIAYESEVLASIAETPTLLSEEPMVKGVSISKKTDCPKSRISLLLLIIIVLLLLIILLLLYLLSRKNNKEK